MLSHHLSEQHRPSWYHCWCATCLSALGADGLRYCPQASLTDAVEGEPAHRRSMESPHASRRSIGSGSVTADAEEKSAKAVAAFKDPRVCLGHHSGRAYRRLPITQTYSV